MAVNETMNRIRQRALEAGVFLPLGVYDKLTDVVADVDSTTLRKLVDELVGRGQHIVGPVEARLRGQTRRARLVGRKVREEAGARSDAAARTTKNRAGSAGQKATMVTPRVATPTRSSLAIARYDSLTVDEITQRLEGLTNTDLAKVYKYEAAHDNRSTILKAIDSKMADLPIATYDALTVDQIKSRVAKMNKADAKRIYEYESTTKKRKTVLDAARSRR